MPLKTRFLISVAAVAALSPAIAPATAQSISSFTEGDVVVSVEGNGGNTGSYTDNQAAPLTLYEYGSSGTGFVGSFALPQTNSGSKFRRFRRIWLLVGRNPATLRQWPLPDHHGIRRQCEGVQRQPGRL